MMLPIFLDERSELNPGRINHANGMPKVYARYGIEHYSRDPETGITTRLEPTFHTFVAYWETAELVAARFRKGDSFIAQGTKNVNDKTGKERFEAKRIGHNASRTRYEVDRSPRARRTHGDHTPPAPTPTLTQEQAAEASAPAPQPPDLYRPAAPAPPVLTR